MAPDEFGFRAPDLEEIKANQFIAILEPDTGETRVFREDFSDILRYTSGVQILRQEIGLLPEYVVVMTENDAWFMDIETGALVRQLQEGAYNATNNHIVTPNYYYHKNLPQPIDGSQPPVFDILKLVGGGYESGYKAANGMIYSRGNRSTINFFTAYQGYMGLIYKEDFPDPFDDAARLLVSGTASGFAEPDEAQWYTFRANQERGGWIDTPAPTDLSLAWEIQVDLPSLPGNSPVQGGWDTHRELPGVISQPSSDGNLILSPFRMHIVSTHSTSRRASLLGRLN